MSNLSASDSVPAGNEEIDRICRSRFDLPGTAAIALIRVVIGLCVLYTASVIYGAMEGYALPTASLFHIVSRPGFIPRIEDYVPRIILLLALSGAGFGWLKFLGVVGSHSTLRTQIMTLRLLHRWGLFLALAAAILAMSDAWSGLILGGDFVYFRYASMAGLIPHSDASNHFYGVVAQIITGTWDSFASRRPYSAAFRELTMGVAGLSYWWTLVVQAVLICGALFAAVRSVALWRGVWCALAFTALSCVLVRPFLITTLSEPLGLFWGFLSVMFFAESMRADSKATQADAIAYAFLALVALTLGEMIRLGSLFTIPAFVLWIALAFSSTIWGRLKLFAIGSGLVLLVAGAQSLLAALYGSPSTVTGGNFGFTLCGLAVGGDWTTCPKIYAEEFSHLATEREQATFLYAKALASIAGNPLPMLLEMLKNVYHMVRELPGFVVFGYVRVRDFPWWPFVFLVPGFMWAFWYRRTRRELLFWALILSSILASGAIIFAGDGWRVFYTTWPFLALFVSLGFASPGVLRFPVQSFKPVSPLRGTVLVAILVAAIIVAPFATRAAYGPALAPLAAMSTQPSSQEIIVAGRGLTGFAVISDDAPFPKEMPAMHASDFVRMVGDIGLERDFGKFLDVAMPHVPFAFLTGARLYAAGPVNDTQPEQLYIAPVQILTEPAATGWRLTMRPDVNLGLIHDVSSYQRLP